MTSVLDFRLITGAYVINVLRYEIFEIINAFIIQLITGIIVPRFVNLMPVTNEL